MLFNIYIKIDGWVQCTSTQCSAPVQCSIESQFQVLQSVSLTCEGCQDIPLLIWWRTRCRRSWWTGSWWTSPCSSWWSWGVWCPSFRCEVWLEVSLPGTLTDLFFWWNNKMTKTRISSSYRGGAAEADLDLDIIASLCFARLAAVLPKRPGEGDLLLVLEINIYLVILYSSRLSSIQTYRKRLNTKSLSWSKTTNGSGKTSHFMFGVCCMRLQFSL